jgi:ATP-binding cassette subfamily F protein 3
VRDELTVLRGCRPQPTAAGVAAHRDDVFKPIRVLSGGERSRVALAKFLIQPTNVLLLDEPTNHLDRGTRRKLIEALEGYDGTIVCASHDPGILERVATRVYEIAGGGSREVLERRKD